MFVTKVGVSKLTNKLLAPAWPLSIIPQCIVLMTLQTVFGSKASSLFNLFGPQGWWLAPQLVPHYNRPYKAAIYWRSYTTANTLLLCTMQANLLIHPRQFVCIFALSRCISHRCNDTPVLHVYVYTCLVNTVAFVQPDNDSKTTKLKQVLWDSCLSVPSLKMIAAGSRECKTIRLGKWR